jgi:hypothetical protein
MDRLVRPIYLRRDREKKNVYCTILLAMASTYLAEMVINFQMREQLQLLDPDLHCDYPARFDHLPDVYPIIHRSVQLVVRVNFVVVTAAASLIVGFAIINKIVLLPKTNLYTVVSPADYKIDKIK